MQWGGYLVVVNQRQRFLFPLSFSFFFFFVLFFFPIIHEPNKFCGVNAQVF